MIKKVTSNIQLSKVNYTSISALLFTRSLTHVIPFLWKIYDLELMGTANTEIPNPFS